jgi:hypothetical protein
MATQLVTAFVHVLQDPTKAVGKRAVSDLLGRSWGGLHADYDINLELDRSQVRFG